MTSFGMLMNSPHSEFQRVSPQKRPCGELLLYEPIRSRRPYLMPLPVQTECDRVTM
jgi:hypothetical protein